MINIKNVLIFLSIFSILFLTGCGGGGGGGNNNNQEVKLSKSILLANKWYLVRNTTRDNPSYYKEERMGQKMIIGNVNDVKNDNIKSGAISSYTRSKGMRILL